MTEPEAQRNHRRSRTHSKLSKSHAQDEQSWKANHDTRTTHHILLAPTAAYNVVNPVRTPAVSTSSATVHHLFRTAAEAEYAAAALHA